MEARGSLRLIRVALDSNILVYLEGAGNSAGDDAKFNRAVEVLAGLQFKVRIVAPIQALGELVVVMRRAGLDFAQARDTVEKWMDRTIPAPSTTSVLANALDIVDRHRLQFWDSMILAASIEAGCSLLLSEDMQDGFTIRGLTVVNPLHDQPHRALSRLLQS